MKKGNEQYHETKLQEETALNRVNIRWTKDEISLAIEGCRRFGQNFKVIFQIFLKNYFNSSKSF